MNLKERIDLIKSQVTNKVKGDKVTVVKDHTDKLKNSFKIYTVKFNYNGKDYLVFIVAQSESEAKASFEKKNQFINAEIIEIKELVNDILDVEDLQSFIEGIIEDKIYSKEEIEKIISKEHINIINEDEETEQGVLYFFLKSLLQVVGSYNNLLNSSEDKPNVLYEIDEDKNFKIVENPEKYINIIDNKVYCCNKLTTMNNYGKVILSNTVKYADSSDQALLSFIVEGPFYSDFTDIKLIYDESVISVEHNNNYLPSKFVFKISNLDYFNPRRLIIKRLDTNYDKELITTITFHNGYSAESVKLIYSPTILFYKDGKSYNNFDVDNQELVVNKNNENYYKNGQIVSNIINDREKGYFTWKQNGSYIKVVENIPINFSKFNVATAVFNWSQPRTIHNWYCPKGPAASTLGTGDAYTRNPNTLINTWGIGIVKGPIHNVRLNKVCDCDLWLYRGVSYSEDGPPSQIKELSLLTYNSPI